MASHPHDIDHDELFNYYLKEFHVKFEGWDFSFIRNRIIESPLEWSYQSLITPHLINAKRVLDMGTGGGEFLSILPFPKETYATEGYEQNFKIARQNLEPLGINVVKILEDRKLDFEKTFFDLIINRHEDYLTSEIKRVLKKEGHFITQQVGLNNNTDINEMLGAPLPETEVNPTPDDNDQWSLNFICKDLEEHGFSVQYKNELRYPTRVFDVVALIYYLKAIPWQVEDFSIEKYKDQLHEIHEKIMNNGYIDIMSERYLVLAEL